MSHRARAAAGGVAALSATALLAGFLVATTGTAEAATTVRFLTGGQMPQDKDFGSWEQSGINDGRVGTSDQCVRDVLPRTRTQNRTFLSDTAEGTQFVVKAADKAAAAKLVTRIKDRIGDCAEDWENNADDADVDADVDVRSYAHQDVENGLSLRGLYVSVDDTAHGDGWLYGIGRDGRYVTVVVLSGFGGRSDAPVGRFTTTSKKALEQLLKD
jgi:hypothetical protein